MTEAIVVDLTFSFIVFCADSGTEERQWRTPDRLFRSVFWMVTLTMWFTHRNFAKLGRFAGIVWFFVTTGWLLSFEYDRTQASGLFPYLAEATLAFVVYCVDGLSADLQHRPVQRLVRCVLWPKAVIEYLSADEGVRIAYASLTVWVLLTAGWLLGLESDRIGALLR